MFKVLLISALAAAPAARASDLGLYDNPGMVPPQAVDSLMKAAEPSGPPALVIAGDMELFFDGARTFEHAGRKYAVKMAFSRARPDAATMGYKPGVRYQLSEYAEQRLVRHWSLMNPAVPATLSGHNPADGTKFRAEIGSKKVEIVMETNGKAKTYKFNISDLREAWQENARNYRVRLAGYDWHFVPQMVWSAEGVHQYYSRAYVISGKEPLDKETGLPLDAVRICTGLGDWWCGGSNAIGSFASSVATGLEIEQKTGSSQELKIKPMNSSTLHYLIEAEVNNTANCSHYNCEKPKYNIQFNDW